MSILQEYEEIKEQMGEERFNAIGEYLKEIKKENDEELFLSDVLYKAYEFERFDDWYNERKKIDSKEIQKSNIEI